jgi:hypothetical protein
MPLLWKFLREGLKSEYGKCEWKVGEWKKEDKAETCHTGFHGSEKILDALSYVKGEVLAHVEVRGECDKQDDKQAWTEMRIKKAYKWTKEESVKLAIFSAELVIELYEKQYPKDSRPREAIEAAKAYLKDPSEANSAADAAAYAADAADAAARAADAAADAAYAAAYAADAAYAAAYAAYAADAAADAAARAAADAADAAARERILAKIEKYLLSRIKELEEIK